MLYSEIYETETSINTKYLRDLSCNACGNIYRVLFSQKIIEELSSGSVNFSLVNLQNNNIWLNRLKLFSLSYSRGIFGEDHLREEEHLVSKYFISIEVVTKETSIRVWKIVALVECYVRKISELLVHEGVLSVRGIKMLTSVFVCLILAKNSLEELHGVEIRISPRRSLEEDTYVEIVHFIVSHGHL